MTKAVIFDMYETLITHYTTDLYFSEDMARDAQIEYQDFYRTWKATDADRTLGNMTFREVIKRILVENNAWTQEKYDLIIKKRTQTKEKLFTKLHPEILTMLDSIKEKGLKIALISNCFDEEACVIRKSILAPYFDVICLSCELGMRKPEKGIFTKCLEELNLSPKECVYCGDGGSSELEAASALGMKCFQACWYFSPNNEGILSRKDGFVQLERPLELVDKIAIS